jgi:hypothetical protein
MKTYNAALHGEESLDRSTNDICVEISKHHNWIWEHARDVAKRSSTDVQGG